nr:lysophospholipid acyltransferase family protein [Sulfurospirillum tamanensis]
MRLITFTCKVKLKGEWRPLATPCVFALWHGELVMMPVFYQRFFPKNRSLAIIVSQHKDGEILAKIVSRLGIKTLRGSSSRGAVGVLKEAFRTMQQGSDVAVTPDGPRGPRHFVAEGVVALSSRNNAPIVTINCRASKVWQFKSWDKMFLPKPFSTIEFFIGEPFEVKGLSKDKAKAILRERLMRHAF